VKGDATQQSAEEPKQLEGEAQPAADIKPSTSDNNNANPVYNPDSSNAQQEEGSKPVSSM